MEVVLHKVAGSPIGCGIAAVGMLDPKNIMMPIVESGGKVVLELLVNGTKVPVDVFLGAVIKNTVDSEMLEVKRDLDDKIAAKLKRTQAAVMQVIGAPQRFLSTTDNLVNTRKALLAVLPNVDGAESAVEVFLTSIEAAIIEETAKHNFSTLRALLDA